MSPDNPSISDRLRGDEPRDRRKSARRVPFHWRQRWRQWLDRRVPPAREITLTQRSVFIFPTSAGFGFITLLALLLLVAINFENSAVYALTFLLSGMLVVSILHTYSNLAGLTITAAHAEPTFAGLDASFNLVLSREHSRRFHGLQLSWQGGAVVWASLTDQNELWLAMPFRTGPRGYCRPGRLRIETSYPFGLLRSWTWIDLDMRAVVYPYPVDAGRLPESTPINEDTGSGEQMGSDDFYGLRDYVTGDSLKSVAWKHYAKTGVLSSKQFIDPVDHRLWLCWDDAAGDDEARLSQLCYWVLQAERGHKEYGLQLPERQILPGRDQAHLHQVLSALATFRLAPAFAQEPPEPVAAMQTAAAEPVR